MKTTSIQKGDATLNIKVIRKNGDIEYLNGNDISISDEHLLLFQEYDKTLKKLDDLKLQIQKLIGE